MSKPINKAESKWKYWRECGPFNGRVKKGFSKWAKKQMKRARRRYYKKSTEDESRS